MRKLLGVLAVGSLCLVLSFGTVGCTPTTPKGKDAFKATTADKGPLTKKDDKFEVTFNEKVDSIDPEEKSGVKATHKDKTATFTQTGDSPKDDVVVPFKVKGKKGEVTVTITVKKKADGVTPPPTPADKFAAVGKAEGTLSEKNKSVEITFNGDVKDISPVLLKGVSGAKDGKKATFTLAGEFPTKADEKAEFKVTGGKDGKDEVTVTITVAKKAAAVVTPPPPPPAEKFSAVKGEGSLDKKDATFEVTFKNGDPKSVNPKEKDGVTAEVKGNKVIFKQTGESPVAEKVVEFVVTGPADATVTIKITVKKK